MADSSTAPAVQDLSQAHLSETEARLRASRLAKLEKLKSMGINPYPYKYDISDHTDALQRRYAELAVDTVTEDVVTIAGRIRALRNSGMFIDLHDTKGKIQVFCHKDFLSEEGREILECLDIGDHIGVEGVVRRTKRGELTINARELTVLSKTLLPLPDKFHGLSDTEARYRQRYLDLIMNEESREVFRKRALIIRALRDALQERGFMEVETPILQLIPGGGAAKPFLAHYNALDTDVYMRIAPELYLKRLIVGGLADRVFEIGRNFRNEGLSPRHNPEFTMLEAYQSFTDYEGMIDLAETLLQTAAIAATGSDQVQFGEHVINLKPPFRRASMAELVKEKTGVDFLKIETAEEARAQARALGCPIAGKEKWGQALEVVFGEKVEPNIVQPVHVCDQPFDISPLAKQHKDDPRLTERFETFCVGRELANAFSELTDPQDQLARFEEQCAQREAGDDEAQRMDRDYVTALEYGLPPTGGIGIGVDRLIMLLTNSSTIRDVLLFPTLKPLD